MHIHSSTEVHRAKRLLFLGAAAFREGKYEEARENYKSSLSSLEKSVMWGGGSSAPFASASLLCLGVVSFYMREYNLSLRWLQEALKIVRECNKQEDLFTTLILFTIELEELEGCGSLRLTDKQVTRPAAERAISSVDELTDLVLSSLTSLLFFSGEQQEEAFLMADEKYQLRCVMHGPRSLVTADALTMLAKLYMAQGKMIDVEQCLLSALEIKKELGFARTIEIASIENNLGVCMSFSSLRLQEAHQLLESSFGLYTAAKLDNPFPLTILRKNIGFLRQRLAEERISFVMDKKNC